MKKLPFIPNRLIPLCSMVLALSLAGCNSDSKAPAKPAGNVADVEVIHVGMQPNEKNKDLELFKTELANRMGRTVEIFVAADYTSLFEALKKGRVQFAFVSPLQAVQVEREADAKILLKKVYGASEFYFAAIVTLKGSGVKSIKDLQKRKFGFVDPKSTSGYLYPRLMLKRAGIDLKGLSSEFFGTHEKTFQALVDKKVDAIAVWAEDPALHKGAWTEPTLKDAALAKRVQVLAYSDPIPNDAFVVRNAYYAQSPATVLKVMDSLISMSDDALMKRIFDVDRMATATSRHYDTVRSLEELLKSEN